MKKIILLWMAVICLTACNSDDKSDTNRQLQIKSITYNNVKDSQDRGTFTFEYDYMQRISKVTDRNGETTRLYYESDRIYYGESNTMTGYLKNGMIVSFEQNISELEKQQLSYTGEYLVACVSTLGVKSGANQSSELTWINGNLVAMRWDVIGSLTHDESYDFTYSNVLLETNLDINWLLYSGEGIAYVAGGDGQKHYFEMQGLCGKPNRNLVETQKSIGSAGTQNYSFEYIFDTQNRPTQVKRFLLGAGGSKTLEKTFTLTYN